MKYDLHIVVLVMDCGARLLMHTDSGEPAAYADPGPAELFCAQLRTKTPGINYRVISSSVL